MNEMSVYANMKESGIDWIGAVPSHWAMHTLYQLVSPVKAKNRDLSEKNLLSLSYGKIKRKNIEDTEGLLPESFDGYNIIEAGDVVLRLTDLQNDHTSLRVGLATERGIITSAYTTLRPSEKCVSKYLYYLLHSFDIRKGFYGMGSGVRQGLNYDEVKELRIILPRYNEQEAIAAYLDEQCALIDGAIIEARSSIDEYKAWKASIIFETVTKGMSTAPKVKHSNSEWLGTVSQNVSISRVARHFQIILGKMLCSSPVNDKCTLEPYYCAANVHFEGISSTALKTMWFTPEEKEAYLVKEGDLLVVEGGAGAGGCAIALSTPNKVYVQNSIMIVRSTQKNQVRYLRYLLEALVKRGYIDFVCNKATIPHFTKEKLGNMPFPLFNDEEAGAISDYLDRYVEQIDALIAEKQMLINNLETYKNSLIFEAVTGKRKVVQ